MKIELLYFEGCPSWQAGLDNLRSALQTEELEIPVELVEVLDNDDAAQKNFLGSPPFRINGIELWSEKRDIYSMSCRANVTPEGMKSSPTVSMLREAIHQIIG